MFYYVKLNNSLVISLGCGTLVPEGFTEISEQDYKQISIELSKPDAYAFEVFFDIETGIATRQKRKYLKEFIDLPFIEGAYQLKADSGLIVALTIKKMTKDDTIDSLATDTIDLRCSRGRLSSIQVALANGVAVVNFKPVDETVIVTIEVLSKIEGVVSLNFQIQLIP